MPEFKPTFDFKACRILSYETVDLPDDCVSCRFLCAPVKSPKGTFYLEFVARKGSAGSISKRFQNFIGSTRYSRTDFDDLIGRYFAVKEGGNREGDFATLEHAAECIECDRARYVASMAYAAECTAEEQAEADIAAYFKTGIEAYARRAARAA
ncbi:hypothetical protein FJ543_06225 [Mesorhizobium sp. B2-5-7]|nr:hypothetical protein FJ543_06225 [Mesorhizobium sp. B2-5-7]